MPKLESSPDSTDPASGNGAISRSKKHKSRKQKIQKSKPDSMSGTSQASLEDSNNSSFPKLTASELSGKTLRRIVRRSSVHPLHWVATDDTRSGFVGTLLRDSVRRGLSGKRKSEKTKTKKWVAAFLETVVHGHFEGLSQQNRADAFNVLAAAWLLGQSADEFGSKAESTVTGNQLLGQISAAVDMFDELPHEDPAAWIWTQVELPLVLAASFSDDSVAVTVLADKATRRLERWLEESVDEEGCLPGRAAADVGLVSASVFRIAALAGSLGKELSQRAKSRMDWMVRQFNLLLGLKNRILFAHETLQSDEVLSGVMRSLCPESCDRKLIRHMSGAKSYTRKQLPDPCHFSEDQGIGVLRCGWDPDSPSVGLACDGSSFAMELVGRSCLLRGQIESSWSLNGKLLLWDDLAWSLNCWHEDKEIQFLELQLEHENGMLFQRQIVLLPKDKMLLIGDALIGAAHGRIDYRLNLPLAEGITAQQESDTREIYLRRASIKSLVMPVTMGEWQRDHTDNAFSVMDDSIQLDQSAVGQGLFAAVAIDLKPGRSAKPRTWRRLTVGENLEEVGDDVAKAGRFQVDREQWVFYRNLAEIGNRTFMGCNVFADFYIGRFDRDGEHETLLMIEP